VLNVPAVTGACATAGAILAIVRRMAIIYVA
jgi:hypothetical protein